MITELISGEIDEAFAEKLIRIILDHRGIPIKLYLATVGGDTALARELYKVIRAHGDVTIHCYGECSSAGTLIICGASKVLSTSTTTFLIHYGEESSDSRAVKKINNELFKWMKRVYYSKLSVSRATIGKWVNGERYFTADEALKYGLIDEIQEIL